MKTALFLASLIAGMLAGTADATSVTDVRQQVVSFADLNLESSADAEILLGRIKSAARKVCGLRDTGPMPIDFRSRLQNCANEAVARAVADVDAHTVIVSARN